ncbi:hypothetical protein [Thermogutta sp.]|uniref:hypothetical protein n=1 Tax=Thermogutta sp. TaxID=1962930 RepID=UPI0032201DED
MDRRSRGRLVGSILAGSIRSVQAADQPEGSLSELWCFVLAADAIPEPGGGLIGKISNREVDGEAVRSSWPSGYADFFS